MGVCNRGLPIYLEEYLRCAPSGLADGSCLVGYGNIRVQSFLSCGYGEAYPDLHYLLYLLCIADI